MSDLPDAPDRNQRKLDKRREKMDHKLQRMQRKAERLERKVEHKQERRDRKIRRKQERRERKLSRPDRPHGVIIGGSPTIFPTIMGAFRKVAESMGLVGRLVGKSGKHVGDSFGPKVIDGSDDSELLNE
ncbi:MAG: hypothetical protein INQ03_07825 [Candidatus Heimdallarchaeota archaeon]|nr:hypothetical protein [Candidatus Heimdallarchaeota archaeon]